MRSVALLALLLAVACSSPASDPGPTPGAGAWTVQLGTASSELSYSVATDGGGNVLLAGYSPGSLTGDPASGGAFVVKLDGAGATLWARQFGAGLGAVATDGAGNAFVGGNTDYGEALDGNASAGSWDLFLVKFDAAGTKQWTRQLGSASDDQGRAVATDGSGNAFVAGFTRGGLDGNASAGGTDGFVVKYDGSGGKLWTRQLGSALEDVAFSVATDGAGNVLVAGETTGALDGQSSAGGTDLFVVKLDPDGTKLWTRQVGSAGQEARGAVATDGFGNVFVSGWTFGAVDGNVSAGGADLFLVKYDPGGAKLWTRQLGSSMGELPYSVTTDALGNVLVAGTTGGGLDGHASAGLADAFVVAYDPQGTMLWSRQIGTAAQDRGRSVASDADGNVFLFGDTDGAFDGYTSAGSADLFVVKLAASEL